MNGAGEALKVLLDPVGGSFMTLVFQFGFLIAHSALMKKHVTKAWSEITGLITFILLMGMIAQTLFSK